MPYNPSEGVAAAPDEAVSDCAFAGPSTAWKIVLAVVRQRLVLVPEERRGPIGTSWQDTIYDGFRTDELSRLR
jgi:hypothetical protein